MQKTFFRQRLADNDEFKNRVVIIALQQAHQIMNLLASEDDLSNVKLKNKATDIINQPSSYKERLSLSVAALLPVEDLHDGVDDSVLDEVLRDVIDAMAGVTPQV